MSVTIDSLQLEIQSNSTNATSGIDGLAKALKNLKKNSDISDAVTNLNNLRKSLHAFVNMPSNASKIESLANAMKSLKKVGKIDLGNSLASVKRAMESLGTINVDNVAPQIERIAGALAPLNNVKGGGFNSTVNGLKKLDDVVDSLDGGSIDRFVAKIKELDEKLTPVSKKLVAIGHAFKGVNTSAISAGKGVGTFRTSINATALNLTNFISVAQSAIAAMQPIINFFAKPIKDALEWDGIEYQFGNAFGEQADIYYQKITEITDALGINKQTFMEISAMSTSMLKGFGVNSFDAREMGLGYAELAYDIWAAYGNKYKTLQDASDAISSAIAGEVEPIRRAGFTIVESQLEITAANHGVAYSAEKATEAQKSYLRYLTLVDQAHIKGIVGAYADEMDTAEGAVRTFTQQLKTLSQTFGAVFLPILVKVMPWLTAFVELLGDAIIAVASVFGVEIQKFNPEDFNGLGSIAGDADNATGSVKDTTKALKDLKNATLGIDELNVISPPTQSGASGGAGAGGAGWEGLDVGSLWDKKIWDDVQNQVDDIKERIKGMLPIIGGIGTAFAGWKILGLLADLDETKKKIEKLDFVVNTKNFGKKILNGLKNSLSGTSFATIGTAIKTKITGALSAVGAALAGIPGWAIAAVAALVAVLVLAIVDYDFTDIGYKIGNAIGKACRVVVDFAKDIGGPIWDGIKAAFDWCKENITWDNVKSFVAALFKKETWTEIIWPKVKEIGKSIWDGLWEGIGEGLENLWGNITEFVDGFVQGFKDGFEIHSPSQKMVEIGKQILAGLLQPLSLTALRDKVKEMWNNARSWWSSKTGLEKVNVGVSLVKSGWSTVKKWIGSIPAVSQAVGLAKNGWKSVRSWIGSIPVISQGVKLAKSGWSSVKNWVGKMPTLSAGIKLVKSGWSSIKSWLGNLDFKLNFKLPKIGVNWGTKTVLGFKISYPSGFYTYAKGGFPDMGEMFIAREAGPELVGKIGSKTTVANNQQIVEAVSEGVYAAVLAAMRQSEGNGGQAVNVYLDGRQITSAVEKQQRERGAHIVNNGVYAY